MGIDFSNTRYYGPSFTVDQREMKGLFTKIDELLVAESGKYDIASALHRKGGTKYAIHIAESVNQQIDSSAIVMPSGVPPRPAFKVQTIIDQVTRYTYPAGSTGIGLVFVAEEIDKLQEQTVFWVAFVDLSTKKMLYTEKMAGSGSGIGFRNHWAHSFNDGIKTMKSHYGQWKKRFAKS